MLVLCYNGSVLLSPWGPGRPERLGLSFEVSVGEVMFFAAVLGSLVGTLVALVLVLLLVESTLKEKR